MDWTQPVPLELNAVHIAGKRRLQTFFGHYDARVYLSPTAYIDVGAGSLGCAGWVQHIDRSFSGCLGSIGRRCEFSRCEVQASGEHLNRSVVNISMSQTPVMQSVMGKQGVRGHIPIRIGSNVTISSGAIVLSGVEVGDGAVVAAGAVVTKAVEPFSIVGGVPSRKLKDRLDSATRERAALNRWWDFSAAYTLTAGNNLEALAMSDGPHQYMADRPRFVFFLEGDRMELIGFTEGDGVRRISEAPERVRAYVIQALGDGPYYWLADCWA